MTPVNYKPAIYKIAASTLLLLYGNVALAGATVVTSCNKGKEQRTITVIYAGSGKVPCDVQYTKPPAAPETLWHYSTTVGECEKNAAKFVKKQESWGWSCIAPQPEEMPASSAPSLQDQKPATSIMPANSGEDDPAKQVGDKQPAAPKRIQAPQTQKMMEPKPKPAVQNPYTTDDDVIDATTQQGK